MSVTIAVICVYWLYFQYHIWSLITNTRSSYNVSNEGKMFLLHFVKYLKIGVNVKNGNTT